MPLFDEGKEVTAVAIKNCLLGIEDRKMLLEVFREHNESIAAQVPFEYSAGTLDYFSGVLFGDNGTYVSLDETALNEQNARRKKKRRRLRI